MSNPKAATQAYTGKELANLYGISQDTFRKWIVQHIYTIGRRKGNYYSLRQVEIVFELFGHPEKLMESISRTHEESFGNMSEVKLKEKIQNMKEQIKMLDQSKKNLLSQIKKAERAFSPLPSSEDYDSAI